MVQRVVGMVDVAPFVRLLKKLPSFVLSRRDCSTYRLVRSAVTSPCGLAGKLSEQPVSIFLIVYDARVALILFKKNKTSSIRI
jgi:hypothetical protein